MGTPQLNSNQNARVTVNVARNLNDPKFEGTPYVVKLTRDAEVNAVIKQVRARDNDAQVVYLYCDYRCSLEHKKAKECSTAF